MSPERSVTYVSERTHKVTGNWALVTTVQNCLIRGTATQFPLFIEWRPVGWQTFSTGVARLADWLCVLPRPRHFHTDPLWWRRARVACYRLFTSFLYLQNNLFHRKAQ